MQNTITFRIDPETTTVGEVVAQNFNTASVFRKYGLDFCCGGGVTIKKACEKKNLDASELMNRLQSLSTDASPSDENFQAWEPVHLIRHIISVHHEFVRSKNEEIAFYAAKVAKVHGDRYPENIRIHNLFVTLANELLDHLAEEEERLFPTIERIYNKRQSGESVSASEVKELQALLLEMVDDHTEAGDLMAAIGELSRGYTPPEDACATYRILYQNLEAFEMDLHKHVHLENNILFRKAGKLVGITDS